MPITALPEGCLQEDLVHEIAKDLHFSYGHRLMNHAGKCKMLHGHNAKVTIKVASESLTADGMVMDFSLIKEKTKNWLDQYLDHQMLLHKDDPVAEILQKAGEHVRILDVHPTAECLAQMIFEFVQSNDIPVTEVTLWETESCMASYKK